MKTPYGITDILNIGFEYCKNDNDETYLIISRDGIVINKMEGEMAKDLYEILVGGDEWK